MGRAGRLPIPGKTDILHHNGLLFHLGKFMPEIGLHVFQRKGLTGFEGKNLTVGAIEGALFMIRKQINPYRKSPGTPGIHRIYQITPLSGAMIFNRTYDNR
jgi:hypothetical protein